MSTVTWEDVMVSCRPLLTITTFPLQMVRDENLKFMKNRDVYSTDYFSFVLSLASLNAVSSRILILGCYNIGPEGIQKAVWAPV